MSNEQAHPDAPPLPARSGGRWVLSKHLITSDQTSASQIVSVDLHWKAFGQTVTNATEIELDGQSARVNDANIARGSCSGTDGSPEVCPMEVGTGDDISSGNPSIEQVINSSPEADQVSADDAGPSNSPNGQTTDQTLFTSKIKRSRRRKGITMRQEMRRLKERNAAQYRKRHPPTAEAREKERLRLILKGRRRRANLTEAQKEIERVRSYARRRSTEDQRRREYQRAKELRVRRLEQETEEERLARLGKRRLRAYLKRNPIPPPEICIISDGLPRADNAATEPAFPVYLISEDDLHDFPMSDPTNSHSLPDLAVSASADEVFTAAQAPTEGIVMESSVVDPVIEDVEMSQADEDAGDWVGEFGPVPPPSTSSRLKKAFRPTKTDRRAARKLCRRAKHATEPVSSLVGADDASSDALDKEVWAFECIVCGRGYDLKHSLKNHLRQIHDLPTRGPVPEPKFPCPTCQKGFHLKINLDRHIVRKHGTDNSQPPPVDSESTHACPECSRKFSNRKNVVQHLRRVHDVRVPRVHPRGVFACVICGKVSQTAMDLGYHKRAAHFIKSIAQGSQECPTCLLAFRSGVALHAHLKTHVDGDGKLPCRFCQRPLADCSNLKKHIKTCHAEADAADRVKCGIDGQAVAKTDFQCAECGLYCASQSTLRRHMVTMHQIVPPPKYPRPSGAPVAEAVCDICNKQFKSAGRLTVHKQLEHEGGYEYKCEPCQVDFTERPEFREHMLTSHCADGVMTCLKCPKTYTDFDVFYRHYRNSHRVFPCSECGQELKSQQTLKEHRFSKHGVEGGFRFLCEVCGQRFVRGDHLKKHRERCPAEGTAI